MTKLSNLLSNLGCCPESQDWVKGYETYESAWEACDRSDWILYILKELNYDPIQIRLIGAWCARNTPLGDGRTTWDLLTDERSKHAIEVAENPESTKEELRAANSAAYFAADFAAHSAYSATNSAAHSAADLAAHSALSDARKAQATHIKSVVKLSDVIKLIKQRG
jgi:hypothetical protein